MRDRMNTPTAMANKSVPSAAARYLKAPDEYIEENWKGSRPAKRIPEASPTKFITPIHASTPAVTITTIGLPAKTGGAVAAGIVCAPSELAAVAPIARSTTSASHAASFLDSHLQNQTRPTPKPHMVMGPNMNAKLPDLETVWAKGAMTPKTTRKPNQTVINTFTKPCIVNRPTRNTCSPRLTNCPIKNGLNELRNIGMTRCNFTLDSVTVPTAAGSVSAENTDLLVAARSRETDSSSP